MLVTATHELRQDWFEAFEIVHFIDTGLKATHYGHAGVELAMDRMGEVAANALLNQCNSRHLPGKDVIKVAPRFTPARTPIK